MSSSIDPPEADRPPRLSGAEHERTLQRGLLATAGALVPILLAILFIEAAQPVLLLFTGYLFGVFLRLPAAWLRDHTGLSHRVAFFVTLLVLAGGAVLIGLLVAPRVAQQAQELSEELPRATEELMGQLEQVEGMQWLEKRFEQQQEQQAGGGPSWLRRTLGLFSTTLGALIGFVIVIWAGIYLGLDPRLYKRGVMALVPKRRHERMAQVLAETDGTLSRWMLGRLLSMLIVWGITWLGLTLLGIPLAFLLSVLAALLTFIPNFGPIVSTVPPALLGLAQSPLKALWVILLFLGIQIVESYLITPFIQKKAISMPPALLLTSQVILASLFGFLGLLIATPLMAAILVLVRRLYVEDALGKEIEVEHGAAAGSG